MPLTCKTHPRYQALRAPRSQCPWCWEQFKAEEAKRAALKALMAKSPPWDKKPVMGKMMLASDFENPGLKQFFKDLRDGHSPTSIAALTFGHYPLGKPLNVLSAIARRAADKFYHDPKTGKPITPHTGNVFMLFVTEIAEAFEGIRKNMQDKHLPHRKAVEVELADLLIRVFNYAGQEGLDLDGAVAEKMVYNQHRDDHKPAARRAKGGKSF